jgi:hypothetical protein
MKKDYKIFLDSDDGVSDVIKKIKKSHHDKIILHIPKDSVLKSSLDNFHTIKRESVLAEKDILIESVDKYIEEIAERTGLKAVNPIFGREENLVSDIIPRGRFNESEKKEEDEDENEFLITQEEKAKNFFSTPKKEEKKRKKIEKSERFIDPKLRKKRALIVIIFFGILVLSSFLLTNILPKAQIFLTLDKKTIDFEETVEANSIVYNPEIFEEKIILPGEMVTAFSNLEKKFPASGEKELEEKATGEIYIYNEFSSSAQILVATTRFVSPSGKVFRLDERVTVPGAEVVGGVVTPSKIKVSVTASEAGEDYNISPDLDEKWTIPGFKEKGLTKRYEGFYGKPVGDMKGGYSGFAKVPTEEDIKNAKSEIGDILKNNLKNQIVVTKSKDFKILNNTEEFNINNIEVDIKADEDGNFGVFAEGEIKMFLFREEDLKNILVKKNDLPVNFEYNVIYNEIIYKESQPDWEKEKINFIAKGSFILEPKVDQNSLKAQLIGQTEDIVKPIIFSIPGLKKAKISLWPFWVKEVPENPSKIKIEID